MTIFRIVTVLIGLIPLYLGGTGMLFGAAAMVPEPELYSLPAINALDSQYRYLAGVYVAVGLMILWSAGDVKGRASLMRFAMLGWFIGGCARGLSWLTVGEPADWQVSGMIVELVVPVVILLWQQRIVRSQQNAL
ncbi:protein of unknown function [Parasphingorhabdus marina DSM 22363]|uniref:DUF4345 domain-containing protein n=1 Tax=Parasphingorhabdus marina DSM 22363 TaxID=1123272 RepID=A0A1N6HJM1_9SPHN|nr:DUF4345 domain-containing protein [Parasphingorhabdus marina]SIO20074.1 protein of unknown function [Parasphingorhabdus marina DSM 22363]